MKIYRQEVHLKGELEMSNVFRDEKAKMSYEHLGDKVTFEVSVHDMTMEGFHNLCRKLALAVGYHPENVKEWFGNE